MGVHVVQSGETLWAISRMYRVSISEIMSDNGLPSTNSLTPGLALYIPRDQSPYRLYRIKSGDSLWKLAVLYNTTLEAITEANPALAQNSLSVGQIITIPTDVKVEMVTLGFIVPYSQQAAIEQVSRLAGQITYLAVAAYSLTAEGYAYVQLEDRELSSTSKRLGLNPLLMIRNQIGSEFSAELIGRVLENPDFRKNLVNSLIALSRERGYSGISIDFEFIPPARRSDFLAFLRELKEALGTLILHVNVHAKTEDIPNNPIIGAYDYQGIARIADIVAVMTIDYGYPGGPPDPVSPAWWIEQVVMYSLTQINPKKLQIAMPLYGYDKIVPDNTTIARSVMAAQNVALAHWRPIQYDERADSPFYQYRQNDQEHFVWFEDIRSYIAKYRLIDLYGLLGTTFWQLSLPAPQNWAYVRDRVNIIKS
ncbi:spore germination protein [Mesobacillus persicus]|uniref:Spore germination protein n=1 Tax=Mesobacillus persicus TaxID=930146 RepID=A0A1H7VVT8_9BACI|nr:LysM peptidoglycan-binding domain-containing protein [Mesobacillus persicus]SEM13361.1 spore germination protein [Mesobacillus persicus]